MDLSLKEKLSGLLITIFFYGVIMSIIFILYAFKFSLNGWVMNTIVLAGYVWADTTLLNDELTSIIGIFVAKGINILFLILYFMIRLHSFAWQGGLKSLVFILLISAVIILIYWTVNKYEDRKNMVMAMVMLCFGVLLYGYVGLRGDYNNYIRDDIFNLGMEVQKVEEMFENDKELEEINSTVRNIEHDILFNIELNYINGEISSFKKRAINTPMTVAQYNNLGDKNREFLEIICSRFRYNIWRLYDYGKGNFNPRKLRRFFKDQEKYAWAYPSDVKSGVHNLIYEWSKKNDEVSRELLLFALGTVDFTKLEEVEKIRGELDLYEAIINFDNYDRGIIWSVFIGYNNSKGEHKKQIETGLNGLYYKEDYRELMIEMGKHDEDFKELIELFEAIYRE